MMIKNLHLARLRKVKRNKSRRNNWFQRWLPKITRVFGLDAVQRSLGAKRARRISNTVSKLHTQLTQQFAKSIGRVWGSATKPTNEAREAGGDTMVEVMISTAVLAVVLATAYTTSTHSLQSGLNAKYRDQALTYARGQVELIKSADNQIPSTVATYKLNRPFCIDPSNAAVQEVNSTTKVCPIPIGETNPNNQSQYSIVDNYNLASKSFTSTVSWLSANNVPNQTTLYYKPHDSFVATGP